MLSLGAEKIILGCTELSLVSRGEHPESCVDAMEVLAEACIKTMGKQVR
jgi:aspartate/glutamate racemase